MAAAANRPRVPRQVALTLQALGLALLTIGARAAPNPAEYRVAGALQTRGEITASHIVIERAATLTVIGDLVLRGDSIRIDGSVVAPAPNRPGMNGVRIQLIASRDIVISGRVVAGDGGTGVAGATTRGRTVASLPIAVSTGGRGGRGGDISLVALPGGSMSISDDALVQAGSGGNGADGHSEGIASSFGAMAEGALGRGGDGGDAGSVILSGELSKFRGRVRLGNGGNGGIAFARGADGMSDRVVGQVWYHASMGGAAVAVGGNGGTSGGLILESRNGLESLLANVEVGRGGDGGRAESRPGATGATKTTREVVSQLSHGELESAAALAIATDEPVSMGESMARGGPGGNGSPTGGSGGKGGDALAGKAADGPQLMSPGVDGADATSSGASGGNGTCINGHSTGGGNGGVAVAQSAGNGGDGGCSPGANANKGGKGGNSIAYAGDGGFGGFCDSTFSGDGGDGGQATAFGAGAGGKGGCCSNGGNGGSLVSRGGRGGDGINGGNGGASYSIQAGNGGLGGSCDCLPSGINGPGGSGGTGGSPSATAGAAGYRLSASGRGGDGGDAASSGAGNGGDGGAGTPGGPGGAGGHPTADASSGQDGGFNGVATVGPNGTSGAAGTNLSCGRSVPMAGPIGRALLPIGILILGVTALRRRLAANRS